MFIRSDKLVIALAPEHLSMARVHAGKVVQAERVDLDPSQWTEAWSGGFHQFDQPLRQLLARFGETKAVHAELFYTSPGCLCRIGITDLDESTSIATMESGLKRSVGVSNPVDSTCLFSDGQSTMTLGIADDESNLQRLFAWLNRSKVTVDRMVPSKVFDVQLAMAEASAVDEGTTVLYISDRSSVIGYFEDGAPKLARVVDIGYNNLSDAYIQSAAMHNDHADSVEMINGQDRSPPGVTGSDKIKQSSDMNSFDLLFSSGVPLGVDDSGEFEGVMPAMSPVLQRISIEIKQTFRFASSIKNSPSKLVVCGPGAAVPKIGAALSQSLDMNVEVISKAQSYKPTEIFGAGTSILAAACENNQRIELVPDAARELRKQTVLGRALKIGTAAVIGMVAAQYYYTTHHSAKLQKIISQQSHVIDQINSDAQRRATIRVMAGSIGTAAGMIEETMGSPAQWVGFLGSIPDEWGTLIRVSGLQGRMNGHDPMITLTGTAMAESAEVDASQVLSQYIKALRELPEVKRVEIGSTSRSIMEGSVWGLKFTLSVEVASESGEFSDLMALCDTSHGVSE